VKDIEKVTKDMCRRYARDSRTIILAVVPANQDMATSDALKMAQEEDPEGARTIGVVTKIDIMDKGTNAKRMLSG
jgi:dynamin 1-like protein